MSECKLPLGHAQGTQIAEGVLEVTFSMGTDLAGWHMAGSWIDETGYFLVIRFEKDEESA